MARRSEKKKPKATTKRNYPRTARLNTLLQQISADFFERVDDDRLPFLTVTGVEVDADLNKAQVFISTFEDESADADILDALADHRRPLQGEIAQQARIRKTPEVVFLFDPAVREGARIETILSGLNLATDPASSDPASADPDAVDPAPVVPDAVDPDAVDPDAVVAEAVDAEPADLDPAAGDGASDGVET